MPNSQMKHVLDALWPEGAFWEPEKGDDYDMLLEGAADNSQIIKDDLSDLANLRDPDTTPILDELEKDFGVLPMTDTTAEERRAILKEYKYRKSYTGAYDALELKLQAAGFDVEVYPNDPAVDPADWVTDTAGWLIINDPRLRIEFPIPENPRRWSQFFFVGRDAVIDPEYGIISIEPCGVLDERRRTLKNLILRYKPLNTWCVYVDEFTEYLDGDKYLDGTWWLNGFGRLI